ncbi:tail-anchored protein insertion receptor WRB-like [Belonocnema kinseyi]|uniref:tail-anchored protein insertion receptor WRB-like n=1 Tax=Belonocnema kinseyi TaxID=2817044 RepID=UPI00143CE267|nr:tail-anchored protein insertion receptor WRB-like [Belonocnema kinseyi]
MYLFITSTLSCFLDLLVGIIIKYVFTWLFSGSKQDQSLRIELINIKQEMNQISMIDEFPKYAKLQRKYNKLENELKKRVNNRVASRMKIHVTITSITYALNVILISVLVYMYRNEPVVVLPNGMLSPLENIFKWPGSYANGISLTMWIFMTRVAASSCIDIG